MLQIGDSIPKFSTKNQENTVITEQNLIGKNTILFFYPKDMTPTCTIEVCNLRDNYSLLLKKGYTLYGVSIDDITSHQKFIHKNNLPFDLLSDNNKEMVTSFGVWGLKKMYGKEYNGVFRTTFIINPELKISAIITKVKSKDHAQQILDLNLL